MNKGVLAEKTLKEIFKNKEYGKIDIGKGKKALIEHTSINPNASPHVGRSRNALIGDSIVRITKFVNFKPEVHYFVNDVGKQIAMLVYAAKNNITFDKLLKTYVEINKKSRNMLRELWDFGSSRPKTSRKRFFDLRKELESKFN